MSLIGQRVGPFEIVEPAVVPEPGQWWLARRAGNQRKGPDTVLVRVLDPDAGDAERGELQRAYDLLRSIEDPRVPAPVAYFEGLGALALDARVGRSLADAMAARADGLPIGDATVLDLLLEVAETLQRVHHRNRVHGHLAAEHVVLARDGGVWIFGFGAPEATPDRSWAAPERLRGEAATAATDQWGLAALAVGLLTGRPPWAQPGAQTTDPDPAALAGAVDASWPALGSLLRRMLDPSPSRRFANLHPVRQELLALARRAAGVSERRELATVLHRRDAVAEDAPEPEPEPAPPRDLPSEEAPVAPRSVVPAASRSHAPTPAPEGQARTQEAAPPRVGRPEDAETPRQAPAVARAQGPEATAARDPANEPRPPLAAPARRPRDPLPEEPIPVVRPHLDGDVPMAQSGRPPAPSATPLPALGLGRQLQETGPASGPLPPVPRASPFAGLSAAEVTGAFAEVVLEPSDPSSEAPLLEELTPTPTPRPLASELPEPQLDENPTSPTVVPAHDSSEEASLTPAPAPPQDGPSQHEDWFQPSSTPAPGARRGDPSLGLSGIRIATSHEPAVGSDDPPSVQEPVLARANPIDTLPITKIAPVLAATMVALVILWFALRLS